MNPEVDAYINKMTQWQQETQKLRTIMLDCGLTEEFKWEFPAYSFEGGNIVVLQGFKKYCAILFLKGVLLKDPDNILMKTGKNTQVGRQIRFKNIREIVEIVPILENYIHQAIEVEKSGAKVEPINNAELEIPGEFQTKLDHDPALKHAFEELTPGRQRAYIYYFSAPKHSHTREARIEKYTDQIMDGIGLNDEYAARRV